MAWIESHQALGRHPKTRKLARSLDVSRPTAVGHLHFLWWWCLDFAQDGDLTPYTDDEIAEAAEWEGDPAAFLDGLTIAGFLDTERRIHDWHDYAGKLIDQRKANAEKQKRWRDRHKSDPTPSPNDNVTVTSPLRNGATVPNRTQPNSTEPDPPLRGEAGASAPAPKKSRAVKRSVDSFAPTNEEIAKWQRQFPELDVPDQLARLHNYCLSHGKQYADYYATFDNWLKRAADEGPPRRATVHPIPTNGRPVGRTEGMISTGTLDWSRQRGAK